MTGRAINLQVSQDIALELGRGAGKGDATVPLRCPSMWHAGLQVWLDLLDYRRARVGLADAAEEYRSLFRRFVAASIGGRCLRLLVAGEPEEALGPNWVDLPLAEVERQTWESGRVSLDLAGDYFDAVLCADLGRVSRPGELAAELRRVLKRAGQLWIQAPLNAPYYPISDPGLAEYWRVTPEGLRVLLGGFDEILCAVCPRAGSALRTYSFFYGLKPAGEPEEAGGDESLGGLPGT